jgi:hypothetical protein
MLDTDINLLFEACLDPTNDDNVFTIIVQSGRPDEPPRFSGVFTGTLDECADRLQYIWNEHQSLLALTEGNMQTNLRCHNDIIERPDVQAFFRKMATSFSSSVEGQCIHGDEYIGRAH